MNTSFILKLYCAAALIGALLVVFTCESAGVVVYCLSAIAGAIGLSTYKQDKVAYYNDNGEHYAILTKEEIKYKIAKDGNYMQVDGQWFPMGTCPDNRVGKRVFDLNNGKPKGVQAAVIIALFIAVCTTLPALFTASLSTPQWVSTFAAFMSITPLVLAVLAVIIFCLAVVWYLGGVTIRFSFSPVEFEFEPAQLPDNFNIAPDILLIQEKGESAANYAKRLQAANAAKGENTLVIAAKGHPVWMAASDDGIIAINRMEGSEEFGIEANPNCMLENQAEYKKSLGQFMRAWFPMRDTAQKRIAALSDADPVGAMAKQMAQTFIFLFFSFISFGQNNSAKALEYLGAAYETVKPSGPVYFHYSKLTIKVNGDGQKTFADLLTHATNFDDAGKWGKLDVVVANGLAIANATPAQPLAAKEKPKGDLQPMPERAKDGIMDDLKSTFGNEDVVRARIAQRERDVYEIKKTYGESIRLESQSWAWTVLDLTAWVMFVLALIFWFLAKVSAKESAIFPNGLPIFGVVQNWIHGWSSGALSVIVIFYGVFYILYTTVAFIMPIKSSFLAILVAIANVALTYWVAQKVIPNKRVIGGQPYTGNDSYKALPSGR